MPNITFVYAKLLLLSPYGLKKHKKQYFPPAYFSLGNFQHTYYAEYYLSMPKIVTFDVT